MAKTANHSNPVIEKRGRLRAPRVLVADNEPANVQLVGALLGELGCEVVPAFDGRTALRRLALREPDLILLDPLLPGLDGIETCRRIRRNGKWRHIPILFLSTADDRGLIAQALEAGAIDYITQPCSLGELRRRLQIQLQRPFKSESPLPIATASATETVATPSESSDISEASLFPAMDLPPRPRASAYFRHYFREWFRHLTAALKMFLGGRKDDSLRPRDGASTVEAKV